MSTFFGLVFVVAWFLGMVQLCGYAYRAIRCGWSFVRFGARAPSPRPQAEPVEPRQRGGV